MFGWLEVNQMFRRHLRDPTAHPWGDEHPHFAFNVGMCNTVYPSGRTGIGPEMLGGGAFPRLSDELVLTAPGQLCRSTWRLPHWLLEGGPPALSYHGCPDRWSRHPDGSVRLRSAPRGQEFVLDADRHPEARDRAHALVRKHAA